MKKVAIWSILLLAAATTAPAQTIDTVTTSWEALCGVNPANDDVRNLALWAEGGVFATVHRGAAADAIKLFNAVDGSTATPALLDMTGIPTGTYNVVEGAWSRDGAFYSCSLSYMSGVILNVYRWANMSATPSLIYTSGADWLGYRMGDAMDAEGSESDNSVKIIISGNSATSLPLILTTPDNGATWNAASLANVVQALEIDLQPDDTFWTNGSGQNVRKCNADGSVAATIDGSLGQFGLKYDADKDWLYTMSYQTNAYLSVWDIPSATVIYTHDADPIDVGGFISGVANGSCDVDIQIIGEDTFIYALSERNGVARYELTLPVDAWKQY